MRLSNFCIRRPVFTQVLNILLIVIGLVSLSRIAIRGYPHVNVPVVMLQTNYPGASPSVIESQVTTPIENQLAGISGLDSMHSSSMQGVSKVVLRFDPQVNLDSAADAVRNLVGGRFLRQLPTEVEAPLVSKRDPNAQQTLLLSLSDSRLSAMALTDYAKRYLLPELQQIYGVADVQIKNQRLYAMRIDLKPLQMATQKVTVNDLTAALTAQNINLAGGEIKTPARDYNVFSQGQLQSVHAFKQLIIKNNQGYLLHLEDLAHVHLGAQDTDSSMRVDGVPAIGLAVYAESEANPITVAKAVLSLVHHLDGHLPAGMHLQVMYNHADFLHTAVNNVLVDLLLAILLVVAVVYLFLLQWRAAIIPIITIPICVISVFTYIYVAGYSINIFTLLALVLAIGLVVDDAIVMLENIVRHVESGEPSFKAALKGSREIAFAVIAMTLTLAAVYAPIGFAQGVTGIIFRQFAFTLAATVLISGFVALTLSPMMCAYLLQRPVKQRQSLLSVKLKQGFKCVEQRYQACLNWALEHRKIVGVGLLVLCSLGVLSYSRMSSSLVPAEDMGVFMVDVTPPANASFSYLEAYNRQLEKLLHTYPGVMHVIMTADATQGSSAIVTLKPWSQRDVSAKQLMHRLMRYSRSNLPEIAVSAFSPGTIGGGGKGGDSIRMSVVSNQGYPQLHQHVQALITKMLNLASVSQASEDLQLHNLQYNVILNSNLVASLQVNPLDVKKTIQTMLGGTKTTTFNWQGRDYDVILQAPAKEVKSLQVLNRMYVRNAQGRMLTVGQLAQVKAQVVPLVLPHQDRLRADTIQVQVAPGYSMGEVVHQLKKIAQQQLPSDYSFRFRGVARDMLQAYSTQLFSFFMALLVIYLVLCAQFESFIDPLIIMLSVPMAVMGALITLYLSGHELSIYASIGLVTLIGLIAKHGILITEFANQQRDLGKSIREAVLHAAKLRLRPILMTTLSMVAGAIPLVFAHGANANGLQPIGWVIVGGMMIGTLFSLLVVPLAYTMLSPANRCKKDYQIIE